MTHILSTRWRLNTPPAPFNPAQGTGLPAAPGLSRSLTRSTELADVALARAGVAIDTVLAELSTDWAVFTAPAIEVTAPTTERLVVGPGGVFVVNGQLGGDWGFGHNRSVAIAGRRVPYAADVQAEALRITSLLRGRLPMRAPVQPVVALLGARFLFVRGKPTSVKVVDAAHLADWLSILPQTLRPIERMELAAVIDNPLTWGIRPRVAPGRPAPGARATTEPLNPLS